MQHTEAYNLNLIETSDTFSPDPLNQNAQLLENAVEAARTEFQAADGALDQRLQVLEAHRLKYGTYSGTETSPKLLVNVGFRPKIVFLQNCKSCGSRILLDTASTYPTHLRINNNGFEVDNFWGNYESVHQADAVHFFVALA